ncbi:EGF-like module-containing mucin-like hormone receptor-like 3-like protein [Anopheles sinensis]|uniref:EGF-like module-containing mucin-like hormone receptor-like 3-like protein n=1 Tax=Anopheles sinensis TaxID=74873 RepID=A0A084VFZ6_ANOSI|nr:EGF-like module-containing mucin-like hormone receptor-like 3-like protein [Anopheles sinensis]
MASKIPTPLRPEPPFSPPPATAEEDVVDLTTMAHEPSRVTVFVLPFGVPRQGLATDRSLAREHRNVCVDCGSAVPPVLYGTANKRWLHLQVSFILGIFGGGWTVRSRNFRVRSG